MVRRKAGIAMVTNGDATGKRGRPKKHYESVLDVCFYLGKSRATLYRMMDQGLPFRYVGGNRKFERSKVDAWLEARTQGILRGEIPPAWQEEQ